VEAFQLIQVLEGKSSGWKNHPACRMFWKYKNALIQYYNLSLQANIDRFHVNFVKLKPIEISGEIESPHWLGYPKFHEMQRGRLLDKNPVYYSQFYWKELPCKEYFWPVDKLGNLLFEIEKWKI
jgi:hypothetical protein